MRVYEIKGNNDSEERNVRLTVEAREVIMQSTQYTNGNNTDKQFDFSQTKSIANTT